MRTFRDQSDREWTVYSVQPSETDRRMSAMDERWTGADRRKSVAGAALPQQYQVGWLTFECGEEKRRLLGIPEQWEQRTDEELQALCESATPSRRNQ